MMRAARPLPELRADRDPAGEDLRRQCARWRDDHLAELREADPDTGERIGRIAQVWRPLLSVADAAGGEWPKKARAAAAALAAMAATFSDGETLGLMLLTDVRAVFEEKGNPQRIASKELDEALRDLPERPWASMPKTGNAITASSARADACELRCQGGNAPVRRCERREGVSAQRVRGQFGAPTFPKWAVMEPLNR